MDVTHHVSTGRKPLAQVLYEASPTFGWTGPWDNLQPDQAAWWEAYADLARQHLRDEAESEGTTTLPPYSGS